MVRSIATALVLILLTASAFGSHSPLLPAPQKADYKTGFVQVRDFRIQIGSTSASKEDEFAATELQRALFDRCRVQVPILRTASGSSLSAGVPVTLDRIGPLDALPIPGENPGPDSREAYELVVSSSTVTIRARS